MNVLIFDPSLVPDVSYQQRIEQLFSSIADTSVRFATGILQTAWHTRHFRPDVIVFDWICDCKQFRKLITILHRIKPNLAMFHIDGSGFIVTESPDDPLDEPAVPHWLHNIASPWLLARAAPAPAMSP